MAVGAGACVAEPDGVVGSGACFVVESGVGARVGSGAEVAVGVGVGDSAAPPDAGEESSSEPHATAISPTTMTPSRMARFRLRSRDFRINNLRNMGGSVQHASVRTHIGAPRGLYTERILVLSNLMRESLWERGHVSQLGLGAGRMGPRVDWMCF